MLYFLMKIARRAIKFDTNTEGDDEFNFDEPAVFPSNVPGKPKLSLGLWNISKFTL